MILRRPYALLIKYFRVIHLVLLALSIYITYKTNIISSFFRNYIANNYSAIITENFSSNFIDFSIYLAIVAVLIILIAVMYLLIFKKKKQKFYSIAIIFYIAIIVMIFFYSYIFNVLETNVISADSARLYRDLSLMIYFPQFIFIAFFGIRALGFNVKQFNFKQDLKDLEINQSDYEEVEVNINFETYKAKRGLRRFIRETGYYIRENVFMVSLVSLVVFGIIIYLTVNNVVNFNNTTIKLNESFYHETLLYTFNDAVITNLDISGSKIKDDKYYLILEMNIKNETLYDVSIDANDYKIHSGSEYFTPIVNLSEEFSDYGADLINPIIEHYSDKTYVLVYELDEKYVNSNFELKLYQGSVIENEVSYPIYNIMKVDPTLISNNQKISTVNLNETVNFVDTTIGNSSLTISNYELANTYYYEAEKCINDNCTTYTDVISLSKTGNDYNNMLMIIDAELELDKETLYYINNKSDNLFVDNFMYIEYNLNDKVYIEKIEGIDISNLEDKIILKVPKELSEAKEISLLIKIRNFEYEYVIKN